MTYFLGKNKKKPLLDTSILRISCRISERSDIEKGPTFTFASHVSLSITRWQAGSKMQKTQKNCISEQIWKGSLEQLFWLEILGCPKNTQSLNVATTQSSTISDEKNALQML